MKRQGMKLKVWGEPSPAVRRSDGPRVSAAENLWSDCEHRAEPARFHVNSRDEKTRPEGRGTADGRCPHIRTTPTGPRSGAGHSYRLRPPPLSYSNSLP